MTTPKSTAPCRACGVQVPDGWFCSVGLLPSDRERRMAQKWCQDAGTFPDGWRPWKRRVFDGMVAATGPLSSFLCQTCVDAAKEETEVGNHSSPIPFPPEQVLDDDWRQPFIYWDGEQVFCDAERWAFHVRQTAHAIGLELPGSAIDGGPTQ